MCMRLKTLKQLLEANCYQVIEARAASFPKYITIVEPRKFSALRHLQVTQPVFAVRKLDITGSGYDDIVACSWEGHTYVVDQHKNLVRFQMDETVSGFHAGFYNFDDSGEQAACLVYTTFSDKVCIYSNVGFKNIGIIPFFEPNGEPLKTLYRNFAGEDRLSRKQLTRWLLYGKHNLKET